VTRAQAEGGRGGTRGRGEENRGELEGRGQVAHASLRTVNARRAGNTLQVPLMFFR